MPGGNITFEKTLPNSVESERAVLGAIILNHNAIFPATEVLTAEDFYLEGHREIFRAMLALAEEETSIDLFALLPCESGVSEPDLELGQKVVRRQKPFELMALGAVRIEDLNRRSPLRSKALKALRLFLDVDFHGDEVITDETFHTRVGVNLGIPRDAMKRPKARPMAPFRQRSQLTFPLGRSSSR
jgi:hypothetical protein